MHLSPLTREQKIHPWEGAQLRNLREDLRTKRRIFHQTRNRMDLQRLKRAAKALSKQYVHNQKDFIRDQCYRIENFRVENQFRAAWDLINCIGNRKK
jgi:hypothetical protein